MTTDNQQGLMRDSLIDLCCRTPAYPTLKKALSAASPAQKPFRCALPGGHYHLKDKIHD